MRLSATISTMTIPASVAGRSSSGRSRTFGFSDSA
jgi:hypothetical protein